MTNWLECPRLDDDAWEMIELELDRSSDPVFRKPENKAAFRQAIETAYERHRINGQTLFDPSVIRQRNSDMLKATKDLCQGLSRLGSQEQSALRAYGLDLRSLESQLAVLSKALKGTEKAFKLGRGQKFGSRGDNLARSFVHQLSLVYSEIFGRKPSASRNGVFRRLVDVILGQLELNGIGDEALKKVISGTG